MEQGIRQNYQFLEFATSSPELIQMLREALDALE